MKNILIFILAVTVCVSAGINADAGLNGYDFLSISPGAAPSAMGGAYTAVSGDIYSLYWNPAGVAAIPRTVIMADYMKYVLDMHRGQLAVALDSSFFRGAGVLGAYLNYFSGGRFDAVDEDGNRLEELDFNAAYTEFGAVFARQLNNLIPGSGLSFGLTLKGVTEQIENYRSQAMGLDVGVHYTAPGGRLKMGAVARNLGQGLETESNSLPQSYILGLQFSAQPQTRFVVDLNKPSFGEYTLRVGFDYRVNRDFNIRGGYRFLQAELKNWYRYIVEGKEEDYTREDFNQWSTGVGLKLSKTTLLDIAVVGTQFQTFPLISTSLIYLFR